MCKENESDEALTPSDEEKIDVEALGVHILIYATPNEITPQMIVFLDTELDVDWRTTAKFDADFDKRHEKRLTEWGEIQNQVSALHAIALDYLLQQQRISFRRMLGEALARGLQGDFANAKAMLQHAQQFIQARNEEASRRWLLEASSISCIIVVITSVIILWICAEPYSSTVSKLIISSAAGAFGALLSVFQRVTKIQLDPTAGRTLHYYEGIARIITGTVGAWAAYFAVQLGLVLTILSNKGLAGVFVVGFIAGMSERFLPTLISQVEAKR